MTVRLASALVVCFLQLNCACDGGRREKTKRETGKWSEALEISGYLVLDDAAAKVGLTPGDTLPEVSKESVRSAALTTIQAIVRNDPTNYDPRCTRYFRSDPYVVILTILCDPKLYAPDGDVTFLITPEGRHVRMAAPGEMLLSWDTHVHSDICPSRRGPDGRAFGKTECP